MIQPSGARVTSRLRVTTASAKIMAMRVQVIGGLGVTKPSVGDAEVLHSSCVNIGASLADHCELATTLWLINLAVEMRQITCLT